MIEENLTGNPFYYIFNDEEIFRLFIGDVLMNLLFTALGIGAKIFDIYRKNKANKSFKKPRNFYLVFSVCSELEQNMALVSPQFVKRI